ncbi:MAG: hypothetical protein ACLRZH_01435 [Ruthenibacterium lactatiformans]
MDEDMLANDDLACPNCGTKFEVDFSEDDSAAKAVKAAAAARTKNKRIPGTKRRKSPSARRAEGLFCFWACRGGAKEKARPCFYARFYRAACVRQYTA